MVSAGRLEALPTAFGGMVLSLALISSNYPILLPWVSKTMSEEAPKEPPPPPPPSPSQLVQRIRKIVRRLKRPFGPKMDHPRSNGPLVHATILALLR